MKEKTTPLFRSRGRKIALVLGGGSARGLAHLGVLKIFKREGIKVDLIVGTSIGALIGAIYSLGLDIDEAIERALKITWKDLIEIHIPRIALSTGRKLENIIKDTIENKNFENLKIPLAIVAADIENSEEVVFLSTHKQAASLIEIIRASSSLPGIFTPVKIGDRNLVDGGVIDSVPVTVARKLGATFIIAVDVGFCVKKGPLNNILQVILQTIQIAGQELNNLQSQEADVVIRPELGQDIDQMAFDKAGYIIAKGEYAAQKMIPIIKRRLKFTKIRKFLLKFPRMYKKAIEVVKA